MIGRMPLIASSASWDWYQRVKDNFNMSVEDLEVRRDKSVRSVASYIDGDKR